MTFEDTEGQVLLDFDRPLRCQDCCCTGCYPNWTQLLEVKHKEQMVGKIREVPNGCCANVELQVQDKHDSKLLGITGPCCPCGCCGADVPFQVWFLLWIVLHIGAKILLSKNSHCENLNFKFTISKSQFSQNSQFQSLIFHKIHIFKVSFFIKIHILQTSNSW